MHKLAQSSLSFAARHTFAVLLAGVLLALSGCNIINRPEKEPAYLTFENPQVVLDENTGFSSNAGIRDVWLYAAGFLQGTYPVSPVIDNQWTTVPYLLNANTSFFMEGGIHETGQSAYHLPYPFWERVEFDVTQGVGDTFVIQPLFHYVDDTRMEIEFSETFENSIFNLIPFNTALTEADSTGFRRRQVGAFMGDYSGFVEFGTGNRFFEVINADPFTAQLDEDIYAEITYRNNINLRVGMIYRDFSGQIYSEPIITLTPTGAWNTAYIHLISSVRNIINATSESTEFWLWLSADGEENDGYIWLDNVRVIHED